MVSEQEGQVRDICLILKGGLVFQIFSFNILSDMEFGNNFRLLHGQL